MVGPTFFAVRASRSGTSDRAREKLRNGNLRRTDVPADEATRLRAFFLDDRSLLEPLLVDRPPWVGW